MCNTSGSFAAYDIEDIEAAKECQNKFPEAKVQTLPGLYINTYTGEPAKDGQLIITMDLDRKVVENIIEQPLRGIPTPSGAKNEEKP